MYKLLPYPQLYQSTGYDCGVIVTQEALLFCGISVRANKLSRRLGLSKENGVRVEAIKKCLKANKIKFDCREMDYYDLKSFIDEGSPVILVIKNHYVTAIGYCGMNIITEDPYFYDRQELSIEELNAKWRDSDGEVSFDHFGIAIIGK
jgi:ABC-type bacteriocin/lantibiotic exporter with double-glycine peptidase domain